MKAIKISPVSGESGQAAYKSSPVMADKMEGWSFFINGFYRL
jgi:hypothetical protein